MERRQLLAATGLAVSSSLSGCIDTIAGNENKNNETWSPEVTASEPSLQAGETTVLTIEVTDAAGLQIQPDPDSDAIEFNFDETHLTPTPESTYQMHPPFWRWDNRTSIEIEQPITVADEAQQHKYRYKVDVIADESSSAAIDLDENESPESTDLEVRTEEFEITIIE